MSEVKISAKMVKELRDRTGLGMMECKKALEEANGDVEVAIDNLRKSGQAKAAKKRATSQLTALSSSLKVTTKHSC